MERKAWLLASGICGLAAPVVAIGSILLAISTWPPFSWQGNALSDMGVVGGITRELFNWGLVAGGALGIVFAAGFLPFIGSRRGKYAAALFMMDCLALSAIGFYPEDFMPGLRVHFYFSVAFFALFPLSGIAITAALLQAGKGPLAAFTLIIAVLAASAWLAHWIAPFGEGLAIPEFAASLCAGAWSAVMGACMLKAARE